ncbi:MAG: Mrp/NBP35 family ATP-binding protein [Candidatus Sericytochromatia bacterium]|nr:Mrp/NBP35 family ATP-binding protein [Candidatus Tanganyikabacteria bacterium]
MAVTVEQVLDALRKVNDPEIHKDLVTLGMVKDVRVDGARVEFTVELTTPACPLKAQIQSEAEQAVRAVPGVGDVAISFSAQVRNPVSASSLPGIRNTVAIGSGKGGVGKSTVAANLALALAAEGARVGLLDADIYGPSIPLMLGVENERPTGEGQTIHPVEAHGIKVMSIGFMLPRSEDPVIWRGPMLGNVLTQFLRQVAWGELDYLLIDLPPGTGDIPLTLVQTIPLSGAAIVITPERVATQIGTKTLRMFQGDRTNVPILGIIENMAAFECPHCHETTEIFDGGGGEALADKEGVPFLGRLPLDPRIRKGGDEGKPIVLAEPDSALARSFHEIARKMAGRLSVEYFRVEQPLVVGFPVI